MSDAIERRPLRHPRILCRMPGTEVALAGPREKRIRKLDPVGSLVWDLADGSHTLAEIADRVADEVDVPRSVASGCVETLVGELVACGFLVWA